MRVWYTTKQASNGKIAVLEKFPSKPGMVVHTLVPTLGRQRKKDL